MSGEFESLSDGNLPSDRARSEVWIDLDNGNFYFWFVKASGERIAEPWLSDIVTIPAPMPTNTAVFTVETEGEPDNYGEQWREARAMLRRVRRRLGIAMPKSERVAYQVYLPTLEHMMRVEPNSEVRAWLKSLLDLSYAEEREGKEELAQTMSQTVDKPTDAPPVDKPRPKTRGEIVQEYADKVLRGEV